MRWLVLLLLAGCVTEGGTPPVREQSMAQVCRSGYQVICESTGIKDEEKCFCGPEAAIDELFQDREDEW